AGGMRVEETAGDLAVAVAILSSHLDRPLPSGMVVFGEVGLTGEVRGVGYGRERVAEAARLGFRRCLLPRNTARGIGSREVELVGIREVREVIKVLERGG
ncbi:MAG: DNA repair protein RadA, partial [Deltaproteobacteria bacterium]